MVKKFLGTTYSLETPEETRQHYDDWADTYDSEITENGYATPARVADALWQFHPDAATPVLDYGCGTGLSGVELARAGFAHVDGMDPSPDMLTQAETKQVYRNLDTFDLSDPTPIPQDTYRLIVGAGLLGVGAAPPETFDLVMKALPKGGLFAFSLNDHALADPAFQTPLINWVDCGAARLLFKEYGPHLPGLDLKSNVYIIEKA